MSVFSSKGIKKLLRNILILFIAFVVLLVVILKVGIKSDYLHVGPYKVYGLYIKLDKKLTLRAKQVIIPKSKSNPSFSSIDRTFDRIKGMLQIFEFIALHDVVYDNNRIDLVFADNLLHINTKDYEIAGKIERKEKHFFAEVPLLYLKTKNITLSGQLTYSHHENRLHTWGRYDMYGIQGSFSANRVNDDIKFDLESDTFSDLKPLIDALPLKEKVKHWSTERIQAKSYKLLSLKGNGKAKGQKFKLDFDTLTGVLELNDASVDFKDGLEPVLTSKITMEYKEGGLYFDFDKPTYLQKQLSGSKVSILNLTGGKSSLLKLDLHIRSPLDEEIQKILQAYKLKNPVLQESGMADASVALEMKFGSLETTAVVDVDLQKADVRIYKLPLRIESGRVHYEGGVVSFYDVKLKDTMYSGTTMGKVKLRDKKAEMVVELDYLHTGEDAKEKMFEIKDKVLHLNLDYKKDLEARIPELDFHIRQEDNIAHFSFKDLSLIKAYIKDKEFIQEGGSVDVYTKDFKSFTFEGLLHRSTCFFYEREDLCHTRVPCSGKVTPKGVDFYAFDKRLHFNEAKSKVTLKDLNIDLEKFIAYSKSQHKSGSITPKKGESLVIIGKNSNLRYQEYTLVTDSYDVEVKSNGDIKAIGSTEGDIIKFEKKGDDFRLNALRIKDEALHPLINFKGLKKGRYSLKQSGNMDKVMKGRIIIEGGVMKDFKAYNNTIALVNTLPAIATLQDPGFSKQGFKIKKGVAEYQVIKGKKIIFDSIYIKGSSSTIVGKGSIDLEKKTIDIKLAIKTAKSLGNIVGQIPLLGYILLGEDKSMTIGLEVKGTLDQPKVETSAAKEILALPLELIKRTIESPKQMVEETKRIQKQESKEEEKTPSVHEMLGLEKPEENKK